MPVKLSGLPAWGSFWTIRARGLSFTRRFRMWVGMRSPKKSRRQRITSSTTRPVGTSLYSPVRRGISRRVRGMHQVLLAVPGLHTGGGGQLDGARGGVDSQGGVGDGIHRVIKLSGLKRVPRRIGGDSPFESHRHALADDQRTPGQDEPQSLPAAPKSA